MLTSSCGLDKEDLWGTKSGPYPYTTTGTPESALPQQQCGARARLDQSFSVAQAMLSFGALWIGGRCCPKPGKETATRTGKGELQGYRRTGEQLRAQQLEHKVGFLPSGACCHQQVPTELVGRAVPCDFSCSQDRSQAKHPDPPWCLSWSNQMPINLSLHRDTASST